MAERWSVEEARRKRQELFRLYIRKNKTIAEIAVLLQCGETTIYDRLIRLGVTTCRSKKKRYNNQRTDLFIPTSHSPELAEFVGILLGDGHLTPTQVTVTLGKKDIYADYVSKLIFRLFGICPKKFFSRSKDCTVYFGSVRLVRWFQKMGLVFNKVQRQVDIPKWIFSRKDFMRSVLRGLFDTDGSVYKLKSGVQISFCNHSTPLISSVQRMLAMLGYHPSQISGYNLYLTRKDDTARFFTEIGFSNKKHAERYLRFRKAV